eukprot:scaffold2663_cov256-Pinguiococcus_pyrenoidosus.AAC.3
MEEAAGEDAGLQAVPPDHEHGTHVHEDAAHQHEAADLGLRVVHNHVMPIKDQPHQQPRRYSDSEQRQRQDGLCHRAACGQVRTVGLAPRFWSLTIRSGIPGEAHKQGPIVVALRVAVGVVGLLAFTGHVGLRWSCRASWIRDRITCAADLLQRDIRSAIAPAIQLDGSAEAQEADVGKRLRDQLRPRHGISARFDDCVCGSCVQLDGVVEQRGVAQRVTLISVGGADLIVQAVGVLDHRLDRRNVSGWRIAIRREGLVVKVLPNGLLESRRPRRHVREAGGVEGVVEGPARLGIGFRTPRRRPVGTTDPVAA